VTDYDDNTFGSSGS